MKTIEKLSIKNFCGISEAEIDLAKFLVLIGPQSSGKSVVSKLIWWSRMTISNVFFDVQEGLTYRDVLREAKKRFEDLFVLNFESGFEICYEVGDIRISIGVNQRKGLKLEFCKHFSELIGEFVSNVRQKNTYDDSEGPRRASHVRRESRKYFNALVENASGQTTTPRWPIYAPAARSFFSQVEHSLFVFLASSKRLDPVVEGFGDYLSWAKDMYSREKSSEKENSFLNKLFSEVLKGKYIRVQKDDFIEHPDGRMVPLSSASSGQQEIMPLCLILNEMAQSTNSSRMFIIEEPEAHLHPSAQKVIVEAIVHAASSGNGQIILTTHSPYVLSIINNLYLAGQLKDSNPEKFAEIQGKSSLIFGSPIGPGDLAAYSVANGNVGSLINPETSLLNADAIDIVSNQLSADFDSFLDAVY